MLVTPDGDVVVLGYFINAETVTFQPRLFIARSTGTSPQGLSNFEEIPLGLGATVYLGGANGSPRMRLAPEVIDGKVRIFAVRQFTTLQSEIVMIEVDLEAPLASPAGETPASPAVVITVLALIAALAQEDQVPNHFIETAVAILGTIECPILGFLFLDDHWRLKIVLIDLKTGDIKKKSIDALNFRFDAFVKVGVDCAPVGDKRACLINAGALRYLAWGGGNHTSSWGWVPRFKPLRPVRSADNFGCWQNLCYRDGLRCYSGKTRLYINAVEVVRTGVEPAPQGEELPAQFGFVPSFVGTSLDVAQIVQGEGLTSITVSNPSGTAQPVEYSLSAQDGTVFQSGEELLEPNQTLTLDVEGTPGAPGAAMVVAPLPLTVQSLTDLSSLVDTPVFGAPGVEPGTSWTLPFVNPAGVAVASGSPAGGDVTRETGVAIHNVGGQVNTCTFTAFGASGEPDDAVEREYQPGQQEAKFVSEIFTNLASSSGLLAVDCQFAVAMVGAIQNSENEIVLTPANPD